MGGWRDFFCRLRCFLGKKCKKLTKMSYFCNLRQKDIYCRPKLIKDCTYMLENRLFEMAELDLTKYYAII